MAAAGTGPPPASRAADAKAARRNEILAAAKEVFASHGFHATKISDVAQAAGVSHGAVYWYFDSKDALFHALMDDQERSLRTHIAGAVGTLVLDGQTDAEALLRRSVQATFEFFETDPAAVTLLFRDPLLLGDRFDRHLGGIYEGFISDIEKSMRNAQSAGQVIDAPPRMIAFSVAALIGQLALRRAHTDDDLTAAEVADFVITMIFDGLRPRPDDHRST